MATVIASTYELIKKLGSGGGGVVYLANHLRLNKKVVLKADKRKITTPQEVLRREVDALKDLNHTYIPQVYDFFIEDGIVYTVIDYVEGESLDRPLKRGERYSQPQVIKWAIQLLEALSYLHNPVHGTPPRGIVHSDIKPANIMLNSHGDIKLIDFNIALALGEENVVGLSAGYASPEHYGLDFSRDSSYTSSDISIEKNSRFATTNQKKSNTIDNKNDVTATIGNNYNDQTATLGNNNFNDQTLTMSGLDYTQTMSNNEEPKEMVTMSMKPSASTETKRRIVIPDARSDIYSLGATLYHLLSGHRPAKNALDVVPLSTGEFSPLIVNIISKSMNPNPDLRYQSADEMLYAFTHLREMDSRTIRRKKIAKIAGVCISLSLVLSVGSTFTGLKRMEVLQKALTNAEYSQNSLTKGDVDSAIEYALEALPVNKGLFSPPYTTQGIKALTDSLEVYDFSDGYKAHHTVELPAEPFKIVLSPDGKTGATVYAFEVAVFDTESGEISNILPVTNSALADVVFLDNDTIVYGGENGITAYNIKSNSSLWQGKKATDITVSGDGKTIAAIYRDENFATIYDNMGNVKNIISFGENKQKVVENDTFADPMNNLTALSYDGRFYAVSFENGGLMVYDTLNIDNSIIIYEASDYYHFEGGFSGQYFAFSAGNSELSEFNIVDMNVLDYTLGFEIGGRVGVLTSEDKIYISNLNTIVTIDPITGEQQEAAFTDSDVRAFNVSDGTLIVATEKNEYLFYDSDADLMSRYTMGQTSCDFISIKGDYSIVADRDTPNIRVLKKKFNSSADTWTYDKDYLHSEARINADESRLMLFMYTGFRIYDKNGNIINEVNIPDAERVYDQQHSKESGNLAVIYPDCLRIYSGDDGSLLYEEADLKSIKYTNYGVTIMDKNNNVKLVNIDTATAEEKGSVDGNNGFFCGTLVDDNILDGREFVGSGKTSKGYYFAVAENDSCIVYDENINELFSMPYDNDAEVFFTEGKIYLSPFNGTPSAYNLENGEKIADLEKDSFLAYVTPVDNYIMSQYISTTGEYYGLLLDEESLEPVAYMNNMYDISNNKLIFDFHKGSIRESKIYSIDELIAIAEQNSLSKKQ